MVFQQTVIAVETNLLLRAEDGEKKTWMIEWEIEEIAMIKATRNGTGTGTEIRDNASLSGGMNQQTKEVKLTLRKSFESGQNISGQRTNLAVARLLWRKRVVV